MPRTYFSLFLPCLIGFSLLATGLSGCTREEKKKARSTVRLNFSRSIESLDSRRTNDEVSANLINMTHEGLLRINLKGDPEPAIAERYTISSDGCTYTFYLRKSNWSDGAPLTAHDFAYAIKSALAPDFVTSIKAKYFPIRGAEAAALGKGPFDAVGIYALDDQTLRFELARPTPYFLELVSSWNYFPVRKNMDEKSASWSTDISSHAFNGPFMIESYLPGNRISLVKNPSYWDAHNVALEAIEISELGDSHTELELFEQGDLDWAGQPLSTGLPIESLEPLRKSGKLKTAPTSKTYFYCLNALSPPFTHRKMRRAFSLAVNRTEIVEHIAGGGNAPALGFVPPVYSAAGADLFIDRAVQQARALFEEALSEMGLDRSTLGPIRISVYPSPVQEKVVQTVARQWEEAFDIKVIIEKSDWSAHLTKLTQKDFQVLCINWYADVPDASTFLAAFDAEQDNLTGWEDERYSQLVRSVATELDTDKRTELIARAEKYLIEAMPAIPLYYNGPSYLINDRLRDVGVSELGLIEFRWASFKPEADL